MLNTINITSFPTTLGSDITIKEKGCSSDDGFWSGLSEFIGENLNSESVIMTDGQNKGFGNVIEKVLDDLHQEKKEKKSDDIIIATLLMVSDQNQYEPVIDNIATVSGIHTSEYGIYAQENMLGNDIGKTFDTSNKDILLDGLMEEVIKCQENGNANPIIKANGTESLEQVSSGKFFDGDMSLAIERNEVLKSEIKTFLSDTKKNWEEGMDVAVDKAIEDSNSKIVKDPVSAYEIVSEIELQTSVKKSNSIKNHINSNDVRSITADNGEIVTGETECRIDIVKTTTHLNLAGNTANDNTENTKESDKALNAEQEIRKTDREAGVTDNQLFNLTANSAEKLTAISGGKLQGGKVFSDTEAYLQVSDKVSHMLEEKGNDSFSMKLFPEGLGEVHITLSSRDDQVTLEIVTDNPHTQKLLESQSNDLKEALLTKNYQVADLSVSFRSESQSLANHSFSFSDRNGEGWQGQNSSQVSYNYYNETNEEESVNNMNCQAMSSGLLNSWA